MRRPHRFIPIALVLVLGSAVQTAFAAPEGRRIGAKETSPADAYVSSPKTLRDAMVKGYLTPVQRQSAKGRTEVLREVIDIALRYEKIAADRREVRRVQAEYLRMNGIERQAALELNLVARTAHKHHLITRSEKDKHNRYPVRLATQLEVNQLVDLGYLTAAHVQRAKLDREILGNLVDLAVSGERLHIASREYRKLQNAYSRRPNEERLNEVQCQLVRQGLGLPKEMLDARLSGVEAVRFFGDALWIGDSELSAFDAETWKTVRAKGYDEGLIHVFKVNNPSVAAMAYETRSIRILVDGRRAAEAIGADVREPGYWKTFRKVHAGHAQGVELLRPWAGTVKKVKVAEGGASAQPAAVHPVRLDLHHPKAGKASKQARFAAFFSHIEDLAQRGMWGQFGFSDRLLDVRRDGSVAKALGDLVSEGA